VKKQLSFPFLLLFTMAFLLTGCEKTKSVAKEKASPPEIIKTMAEIEEIEETEIIEDKEKSVTTKNTPATDNQKFEGSQTLKRYMEDSP